MLVIIFLVLPFRSIPSGSLKDVHVVHELLEVADANLCAIAATAGQDEQLDEGLENDVAMLRLVAQNLDHVMLLKLDLLVHGILQEVFKGQWLCAVALNRCLRYSTRKCVVSPDAILVVRDHVALLNDVELVDELLERACTSSDGFLKGSLSSSTITLDLGASRTAILL